MKKTMCMMGLVAVLVLGSAWGEEPAATGFKFPGWKCSDAEVLQAQLALAPDDGMKIMLTYMIDFAQNGVPATFADACSRIDAAINVIKPEMPEGQKIELRKTYAYCTGQFLPELIAYCKDNPSSYDFYIARKDKTEWGYQTVADYLLKYSYPAESVIRAVDYLNRQAIALGKDDAEVLGLLKKLNRVFSALLDPLQPSDWDKVVSKVRTLMDTYK